MLKREISETLISWKNQNEKESTLYQWSKTDRKDNDYPRVCERAIRILY